MNMSELEQVTTPEGSAAVMTGDYLSYQGHAPNELTVGLVRT